MFLFFSLSLPIMISLYTTFVFEQMLKNCRYFSKGCKFIFVKGASKMKLFFCLLGSILMSLSIFGDEAMTKGFVVKGVLTDVQKLFKKAQTSDSNSAVAISSAKKFKTSNMVITDGVALYSFLENEGNESALEKFKVGDVVEIKGNLLIAGNLIDIESIEVLKDKLEIDLKKISEEEGKSITLDGVNKCQCGLKVGELKHSCKLGHLHHLQTEDGKIYHYLAPEKSKDMSLHFKKLKVDALLFPGNFIFIKPETK